MNELTSISGIKNILSRYNMLPKKGFGQNFLTDRNILNKIIDSLQLTGKEYIVEIGPGLGVLTTAMAPYAKGLLAIDTDTRLKPVLEETCKDFTNIRFHFSDVLKTDIERTLLEAFCLKEIPNYIICANIPYNITSPIIFKILEDCPHLLSATLMMQKEVAERLVAKEGTKSYGRLTLTVKYYAETKKLLNVSHNCFHPAPKVDSAVVCITPKKELLLPKELQNKLMGLFNIAFQQRRKVVSKIFADYFGCERNHIDACLHSINLSSQCRPENLSLENYVEIIKTMVKGDF